ncbi:GNAT family N-acetyltransferase [bacterium]|nr:GNAT family N-acetyltransferase [bacterium]
MEKIEFKLKPGERIKGEEIDLVLDQCFPENLKKGHVPAYRFFIVLSSSNTKVGYLNLRIGTNVSIEKYAGHIGYGIDEEFRGNNYAAKACNLTKGILKQHAINPVWITSNPENQASIKTLQRIGAEFIETLDVPKDHEIYLEGDHRKSRFLWNIKR